MEWKLRTNLMVTVLLVLLLGSEMLVWEGEAAGECGRTPIGSAAASLSPCLPATHDGRARVPPACCARVSALLRTSPRCLCAVLLSPLAKQAKINPAVAITVPKRCNIRNRPAGKKCGKGEWSVQAVALYC
ncbi:Lipid transfer protein [Senna tora]|uniref:Lipid transfer protein n=1 Tax=Senna tora TaxID=362788 RepID=A0A834WRP8_9FABA|nr:Lipid transfer protein [Senna tora]